MDPELLKLLALPRLKYILRNDHCVRKNLADAYAKISPADKLYSIRPTELANSTSPKPPKIARSADSKPSLTCDHPVKHNESLEALAK